MRHRLADRRMRHAEPVGERANALRSVGDERADNRREARAEIEAVVAICLFQRAIEMIDQAAKRGAETGGGVVGHGRSLATLHSRSKMYKRLRLQM